MIETSQSGKAAGCFRNIGDADIVLTHLFLTSYLLIGWTAATIPLVHVNAAVHMQNFACNKPRLVTGQECDHGCNLIGSSEAA